MRFAPLIESPLKSFFQETKCPNPFNPCFFRSSQLKAMCRPSWQLSSNLRLKNPNWAQPVNRPVMCCCASAPMAAALRWSRWDRHKNVTPETYRQAGGGLARWLKNAGVSSARIDAGELLSTGPDGSLNALLEGLYLGAFEFTQYKSDNHKAPEVKLWISGADEPHSASSAPKRSPAP
jgi:hypothetical protein